MIKSSLLCFVTSLVAVGCAFQSGDRVDGSCPAGEVCSSETDGLDFSGSPPASYIGNIVATAEGGTQRIRVHGWSRGFDAAVDGPSFVVDRIEGSDVIIRGVDAGASRLRILHPVDGTLLDRTGLEVKRVARMAIVGQYRFGTTDDPGNDVAFYAGGVSSIVVRLLDPVDDLVVDENLTLSVTAGSAERTAWDRFTIDAPEAGVVGIDLAAAGLTGSYDVPVVSSIDDITMTTPEDEGGPVELEAGDSRIFCFSGHSGDLRVLGTPFGYATTGSVEIADDEPSSCVVVEGLEAGAGQLMAEGPGATMTVPIDVIEARSTGGTSGGLTNPGASLAHQLGDRL
jgi:hypothetical protein